MKLNALKHNAYSRLVSQRKKTPYYDRERIDSMSPKIQGGVYYPESLPQMEAIVVDYNKDQILKEYLVELEEYTKKIVDKLHKAGRRNIGLNVLLEIISHKITADFPYSHRMNNDQYSDSHYDPGQKYYLGRFMTNQDMVCRHMGLLVGAAIDYFKENGRKKRNKIRIGGNRDMRFMAEEQKDIDEGEKSGHAYLVLRDGRTNSDNVLYVIDPAAGFVANLTEATKSKELKGKGYYRYLFSLLRFLMQDYHPNDENYINKVFQQAKADPRTMQVLRDIRKNLRTTQSIARFNLFMIKAAIN